MSKKDLSISDTVLMEGRETFSAWPITFTGKPDAAGLIFTKKSELKPPNQSNFDGLMILLHFFVSNSEAPDAPYKSVDAALATVLSWRLTPAGLWIRGGFVELEDPSPYESMQKKLKLAIKAGRMGLTYTSRQDLCVFENSAQGTHVHAFPLLAFTFYEKEPNAKSSELTGTPATIN